MKQVPGTENLPEDVRKRCVIPDDCEIVSFSNRYNEGGPLSYSYRKINPDPAIVAKNRKDLEDTIQEVLASVQARLMLEGV